MLLIPKGWVCLFILKGATNWQDVRKSPNTHVLFELSSPKIQKGCVFKLYELGLSISSISVVLIEEMGVFASPNTLVGSGRLFMHISLKLLVTDVIFTEHDFTISFIPVILLISQQKFFICYSRRLYNVPYILLGIWTFSKYSHSFHSPW